MPKKLTTPRRMGWFPLAPLLLLSVVIGSSCRSEQDQQGVKPAPSSPAATDSDAVPSVAEPAPDEPRAETDVNEAAVPGVEPQPQAPPDAEEPDAEEPEVDEADMAEEDPADKYDFGEPLVEGLGENQRLQPKQPIWLSKDCMSVVMQSMVCQRQAPLEMFACLLGSKEHESVLAVPVEAYVVHTGLLATGAESGTPVRWDPHYAPPTGTEIEISMLWKDEEGKVQTARAQEWVRDVTTGKAMANPWVFAGSKMYMDEETGEKHYLADSSGELICVSNFPTATLDVPIESSDSNASLAFEAFTEKIPPLGTPVTLVLTPKLKIEDSEAGDAE